ncbi:hypothetical protein QTP88_026452 [Uroleucon formosanum]
MSNGQLSNLRGRLILLDLNGYLPIKLVQRELMARVVNSRKKTKDETVMPKIEHIYLFTMHTPNFTGSEDQLCLYSILQKNYNIGLHCRSFHYIIRQLITKGLSVGTTTSYTHNIYIHIKVNSEVVEKKKSRLT